MAQPLENRLGVCSWSLRPDNARHLVELVKATGLRRVQLALAPLCNSPAMWADAPKILGDSGIAIASGMLATVGEDYSTIEAIHRTGGIVPDPTWPASRQIAISVLRLAGELELSLVTFHAGFIPADRVHPVYAKARDRLRELADRAADHGLALGLETGQETAKTLDAFLADLDRSNVGVNFDPANMLLYGSGDPIEAVRKLGPRLRQVHIKDAKPASVPGTWGEEVVAGTGAVDWPAFAAALREANFRGDFLIEREAGTSRVQDIAAAREMALRMFQRKFE